MGLQWSIHTRSGWKSHYHSMLRWHTRFINAHGAGIPAENVQAHADALDFGIIFFQHCHHLPEIIKITATGVTQKDVEEVVSSNYCLKLCRDIANSSKHFQISRPSIEQNISIGFEYSDWPGAPLDHLFVIVDDKYEFVELANECRKVWDDFIQLKFPDVKKEFNPFHG